jgi:predicted RNase H-like HicB family nuclease
MPKYEVIIFWSEEDQAFIAEVPELPGCAADGKTYREALKNAETVIQDVRPALKEHHLCRFEEQRPHGRGGGKKLYRSF